MTSQYYRQCSCSLGRAQWTATRATASRRRRFVVSASAGEPSVALPLETAKEWFEKDVVTFVDLRSARDYDYEHITKPIRRTVNVPHDGSTDALVDKISSNYKPSSKLLLVDATGEQGIDAAGVLRERGYEQCYGVEGGYEVWMKNFTTTGRRRIQGKFVSSGKEALKSGLNLDAAVASTYEENHGRADLSLPSNRVASTDADT